MSGSSEQDYFADGITEDIITELSRYKNLAVVALLERRFEDANAAYQRLLDPPFMFKFNRAACLFLLGRIDEARAIMREKPEEFDTKVYAENSRSHVCLTLGWAALA
jgi:hypothetical protein